MVPAGRRDTVDASIVRSNPIMPNLVACSHCHAQYDVTDYAYTAVRCSCGMLLAIAPPEGVDRPITRCGQCGAPMAADAERCDYCGVPVARDASKLICPECFARMPASSRFCRSCGVEIHPEPLSATPSQRSCPRCEEALFGRRLATYLVDECGRCHGIWVHSELFSRLVNNIAKERAELPDSPQGVAPVPLRLETVQYLKCPECSQLMNRRNFEGISGIILDECRHGWWFDANELEAVARFVAQGGIAKARAAAEAYEAGRRESDGRRVLDNLYTRPKSPAGVVANGFLALLGLK
jgi:Zn-finger nucleic acid-binding protein/ribosomal protein L40E